MRVLAESSVCQTVEQCHTKRLRQKCADLKLHVVIGKEPAVWLRAGSSPSLNTIQVLALVIPLFKEWENPACNEVGGSS